MRCDAIAMRAVCVVVLAFVPSGCGRPPTSTPMSDPIKPATSAASISVSSSPGMPSSALPEPDGGDSNRSSVKTTSHSPIAPTWHGDSCNSDVDCGWSDPCSHDRCVSVRNVVPSHGCDTSPLSQATCVCVQHMCALKPVVLSDSASPPGCKTDNDCAVDAATGTCHLHGQLLGPIQEQGPLCLCSAQSGRCELQWWGPIPCESWRDCSYVLGGRARPASSRQEPRLHNRPVRPCMDGERDSVCEGVGKTKTCRFVVWSC